MRNHKQALSWRKDFFQKIASFAAVSFPAGQKGKP